MSLCPEHELREKMSDDEFWAHVFPQPEFDEEDFLNSEPLDRVDTSCSVCGSNTACGYDSEGRPLIHSEGFKDTADDVSY